ncbi:MAG TPA: enoyl-CoA hydratase [Pseudonocardia sp.]|jgi:enoyl-CoA hydratase|uniref:enoyl-CoA hydratase n=1 Tax=Pseudonocardia sp. TaxID=60912 RepID=UPI002B86EFE7|nr:enoyl-CoA hydratase [Pseudonocardia sp.]HTF48824.1 enoyl-CoA hydratase [Pseudonocardia sp.]
MADSATTQAPTTPRPADPSSAQASPAARGIHVLRHGRVAVITVSDPARRNAMAVDLAGELVEAIRAAERDEGVGAVVVTGEPPAFCAGADLSQLGASKEDGLRTIYQGFLAVAQCTLPTIAAVNGAAVGAGVNLALACDLRLAGPKARFDSRFLQLGLHPGGGYTWMAHRVLGPQGAAAVTLFGENLGAEEAERAGLVWRAVDDPLTTAVELAGRAADAPRDLVITTKRTMRVTASQANQLDAVELEIRAQVASLESPAFAERLAALKARVSGTK